MAGGSKGDHVPSWTGVEEMIEGGGESDGELQTDRLGQPQVQRDISNDCSISLPP